MKKIAFKISILVTLIVCSTIANAQTGATEGTPYDSLATSNIHALISQYSDLSDKLFNTPFEDSLRIAFNSLFRDDALLFRDYTTGKSALSPEEYVYYLQNFFGENKPSCQIDSTVEIIDLKYIANGNYYVAKAKIKKHLSFIYDKETETNVPDSTSYELQLEILANETIRNTRFLGIRNITPAPVIAVAEEEVIVQKEPKQKVVKEKEPKEKKTSATDNLVFLNWSLGSNLSMSSTTSENSTYTINDFSYMGWQVGLSGLFGLSKRVYVGANIGLQFGTIDLTYDNTNYSFIATDDLNASVDNYERNAFISSISETITFTNLNLQALINVDLISSDNNKILLGTGITIGVPISESSDVVATTKYTGTYTHIGGVEFIDDFTIGDSPELPLYGFNTSSYEQSFDMDSKMALSLPINLKALHVFDNNFFIGAGIECLVPLSTWLEGGSNKNEIFFKTNSDLDNSIAAKVSASKRPFYFGGGISIGIQF